MDSYQDMIVKISDVLDLLSQDYDIDVDSPDGWVPIVDYVDKGVWEEYILTTNNIEVVRCNESHLFETPDGWKTAKELSTFSTCSVLSNSGDYVTAIVNKTKNLIPIVDIQVDHPNHRYYANGISSHNTNVGKSLAMCHMAASNLMMNKNVLYITCEMAEERIAERIDANVLDISLDTLKTISKPQFMKLINSVKSKITSKLVVKEYPTSTASAAHFRYLLHELALKKNFVPDIIYIDYMNICASSRIKNNGNANSYTLIKSVAEELRGLAVEMNLPIVSASQLTRSGFSNSDAGMTDVSESFGTVATADLVLALINTEELEKLGQLMVKQLKNRYNDVTKNKKFLVGVDRGKMRLFDIGDIGIDGEGGIQDDYKTTHQDSYDEPEAPWSPSKKSDKFSKFNFK